MIRLKELRQEKKLSQKEIANFLGVNEKTISRWEKSESTIKSDKAQALADYFGVSVGYLLGYSDTPELIKAMIPHSVLDEDGNPTLIEEIQQSVFTTDKDDELIRVGHIKALSIVPGNIEKHLNGDPKNIYRMMAVAPTDYQSIIMLWAIMTPEQRKATLTLLQTFNFEDKN